MKHLSIHLLFLFIIYGCAPADSSRQSGVEVKSLPERPLSAGESLLRRELQNTADPRISYCEILGNDNSTYSGIRDTTLQPLASLSKVITSSWALEQLGSDYRFRSEVFMKPVNLQTGLFDVYLRTNYDPIVNIEKLLYFISELKKSGVKQIRNLMIDETTRVFLGVLSNPHIELAQVPVSTNDTIENLSLIFNSTNWAEKTRVARQNILSWAEKNGKIISIPEDFSVGSIAFKMANQIDTNQFPLKKEILSAPLFRYLKNLNVYSNNYLADALFSRLGGRAAFLSFQNHSLQVTEKEMIIYTGSGLANSADGTRRDNVATCFSMIKVLAFFKNKSSQAQLNLGSLLLNPSLDTDGTFDVPGSYGNALVLKTGRLYDVPALNVAGFVSTEKGVMSFVFLGHDFSATEADEIEASRSGMLADIYSKFKAQASFTTIDYQAIFF